LPKELQWTRELINSFWDGFSQTPLKDMAFAKSAGTKLLDIVGRHLPPNARCLDFGSGGGDLLALLIERGCQAAGFEPSTERSNDMMKLPFASNPNFLGVVDNDSTEIFDVVIAAEVLEHVLDAELPAVVKRLRDFLKPGGILIATTPNNEDLVANFAYCPVSDVVFHRWQHVRSFTAESLDACLSAGGFQRIEDHRVDYSSYADLARELREAQQEVKRLRRKGRYQRRFGPLYPMVAPLLRSRIEEEKSEPGERGDLRIGGETNLIYVGKAV
jgi:2-polyprenyl-3-methyl-5-hydroxy-6-metoxy-1,4-benzoquinol methylase